MRSIRRALTGTLAAAIVAGGFALVSPASADPGNGEGCAGVKEIPAAFVCVISVTPTGVVPSPTTTSFPVDLPTICYVAGCTNPAPVNVPVPGATPGNGQVAVLYYNGQYIPVAVGTDQLIAVVESVITLATSTAGGVIDGLPTPAELEQEVLDQIEQRLGPTLREIADDVERLREVTPAELVSAIKCKLNSC